MTAQRQRVTFVVFGVVMLAFTSLGFVFREKDAHRACEAAQQNYDTLVRLVNVPSRDPIQRAQLLDVLGARPDC